jgi:DNA-binding transcriptional LysR family regulator
MERFFSEHNLEVDTYLELTSNEAVKQAVIAGLGYSVLPLIGIREELMSGTLQIIPVRHWYADFAAQHSSRFAASK